MVIKNLGVLRMCVVCHSMLTTMVIKSLEREATRELVDQELSVMGGFDGFGASELRFLMHWVRSELMGYFAAVQVRVDACHMCIVHMHVSIRTCPASWLSFPSLCAI